MALYDFNNLKRCTQTGAGQHLVQRFKEKYETEYSGKPIAALTYAYRNLYYINGSRWEFEKEYLDRRQRLAILQVLAVADESYIQPLEEILSAICEEFTWVLPAHHLRPDNTFDYTIIDLFSAETACYLAETAYIFKERLSPDIRGRILMAVEKNIFTNYESRTFDFETATINWAAVCACGVGLSYLYLCPQRFATIQERLFSTFKSFLRGFGQDGYCSEGINYWQYGFGMFCVFFDAYVNVTGNRPSFLDTEQVTKILKYAGNAKMGDGVYLPFADGGLKRFIQNPPFFLTMKHLYEKDMELPKLPFFQDDNLPFTATKALWLRVLCYADDYLGKESCAERIAQTALFYPEAQVYVFKSSSYSFAVKGGCNGDSHNHNDIGAFQIVKGWKRLICDFGAGRYTKDYFANEAYRYGDECFVCGSQSHSVPILDGTTQSCGEEYKAILLQQSEKGVSFDISGAYNTDCKAVATYVATSSGVQAKYRIEGLRGKVIFRFVSDYLPLIENGKAMVEGELEIIPDREICPKIAKVDFETAQKVDSLYTIDYEIAGEENVLIQFDFIIKENVNVE